MGWARRLQAHPAVAAALAAGEITASWARELCSWTDQLPEDLRADADAILLAAAAGGADLHDLAGLALEMIGRSRTAPDEDADREFNDRQVGLETTLGGAAGRGSDRRLRRGPAGGAGCPVGQGRAGGCAVLAAAPP